MAQLICVGGFVFAELGDDAVVNLGDYPAGAVIIPWADREAPLLPCSPSAPVPSQEIMETPDGLARHAAQYRNADTRYAPVPTTPDQLRAYAASRRYYRSIAGVTVAGVLYATDDDAERRITLKWSLFQADKNATIAWKAPNGFVTLDLAGFTAMAQGVAVFREACFAAEATAQAGIAAGTVHTMADIDAIIGAVGA